MLDLKRPPTAPGEMLLEEFLRPAGLTQVEAARRMGILFRMSPEFWTRLQADWDLWHAAHALRKAG